MGSTVRSRWWESGRRTVSAPASGADAALGEMQRPSIVIGFADADITRTGASGSGGGPAATQGIGAGAGISA